MSMEAATTLHDLPSPTTVHELLVMINPHVVALHVV
jgi:hypothetical protein